MKIDIDLNKYKPEKSDLQLLKSGYIIAVIAFAIFCIFGYQTMMAVQTIIGEFTEEADAAFRRGAGGHRWGR